MPSYTAYLKVSEGCDNACAFCIIPKLRGKQRSRSITDLVQEAQRLANEGVVELNLIAQDLTGYGHDLPGKPTLAQLLDALGQVKGIRWVRCMYMYPRTLSEGIETAKLNAELRLELIAKERDILHNELRAGRITDESRRRLERELDLEEAAIVSKEADLPL